MIKLLDFIYVCSHIWLILPRDDRHFFFRHRPVNMIATLAKNKHLSAVEPPRCLSRATTPICKWRWRGETWGGNNTKTASSSLCRFLLLGTPRVLPKSSGGALLSLSLSPLRSCLSVHYLSFKVLWGWPWQHHCLLLPVMYVCCVSVPPNPKSSHCVIFELCMSSGCFLAMAWWFLLASAEAVALKSMRLDPRNFTQSPGCIGVACHGQCLKLLLLLQWPHFLLCGLLTCLAGRACRVLDPSRRNRMPMATMRAVPQCWSSQVLALPSLWSIHLSWLPIRRFLCILG